LVNLSLITPLPQKKGLSANCVIEDGLIRVLCPILPAWIVSNIDLSLVLKVLIFFGTAFSPRV